VRRLFGWLWLASACAPPPATPPIAPPASESAPRELTILYTSDEHGWIAPKDDRYAHLGGASQLLGALLRREAHCPGSLDADGLAIRPSREHCPGATLLLSGGDNYTGPAVSTHLRGRSVADTMRVLGYAASAFGNHELDFGHEALLENRRRSGVRYLAANMVRLDGKPDELAEPYAVFERNGVKLGVIGIATVTTPSVGMRQRFVGYRFDDVEATLARTVPRVWSEDVDAVVVVAHECHDVLAPLFARHPEWDLAFVGTGHCHRSAVLRAGATLLLAPAWSLSHYGRVRLRVDPTRPKRKRAELVDWGLVDVASPVEGPLASGSSSLDAAIAGWQRKVDVELGEVIGHSQGMAVGSPAMSRWILGAWLDAYPEAELALTTRGALRQELSAGPVTLASVQSVMPFENELVLLRVPREEVPGLVSRAKSLVRGVRCDAAGCTREDGTALAEQVTVVTTDFLYHGGDGYALERFDPRGRMTGTDWRAPVIAWTRASGSTRESPLEAKLSAAP